MDCAAKFVGVKKLDSIYKMALMDTYNNLTTNLKRFSCHKFASNVVEKAIQMADPSQLNLIIQELI